MNLSCHCHSIALGKISWIGTFLFPFLSKFWINGTHETNEIEKNIYVLMYLRGILFWGWDQIQTPISMRLSYLYIAFMGILFEYTKFDLPCFKIRVLDISQLLYFSKVHIFWEGHKILRNLQLIFVLCSASQK